MPEENHLIVQQPDDFHMLVADDDYLKKLRDDKSITPEQWEGLRTELRLNAAGPLQPSIICHDNDCEFARTCSLKKQGFPVPRGKSCPIEDTFRAVWLKQLQDEIGTDADGYASVDTGIIVDVVNTMIELHRGQQEAALTPKIAMKVIAGIDKLGDPIVDLKMNPVLFSLKASRKMKAELLKHLIATRDARSKDKSRKTVDAALQLNALRRATDGALEKMGVKPGVPTMRNAEVVDLGNAVPEAVKALVVGDGGAILAEHLSEHAKEIGIKPLADPEE